MNNTDFAANRSKLSARCPLFSHTRPSQPAAASNASQRARTKPAPFPEAPGGAKAPRAGRLACPCSPAAQRVSLSSSAERRSRPCRAQRPAAAAAAVSRDPARFWPPCDSAGSRSLSEALNVNEKSSYCCTCR